MRLRFQLRTMMIVVILAAIASALLAAIQTIDDRERLESYKLVAGWCVCAFGLLALIRYRAKRLGSPSPRDPE